MLNKKYAVLFISFLLWSGCEEVDIYNEPVSVSIENEMFKLEIEADTDAVLTSSAIPFTVTVSRLINYYIRHDSRIIGSWDLFSMTVDDQALNISQFPTGYDFYLDGSYTEQVTNTITSNLTYSSGAWVMGQNNDLILTEQGVETNISVYFDTDSITVPSNGFMVWNYTSNNQVVRMVFKKYSETDETQFLESISYLSVIASGNAFIDSYTQVSAVDINITLGEMEGDKYEFPALFTPGVGVEVDVITASFETENYELLTVQLPIKIRAIEGTE
jgi:hypothetical protein